MRRALGRVLRVLGVALLVFAAVALVAAWDGMGRMPAGERLRRMTDSPQWDSNRRVFENPEPLYNDWLGMVTEMLDNQPMGSPGRALPVQRVDPELFDAPPASGLRITWLGHSTLMIEIDGVRVLTDPVFGARSSPIAWLGPERWYEPPIALEELPPIDVVVISHDHYDHLDHTTIRAMAGWDTRFVTPLGVGEHLAYWGVPEARILELDWWERTQVDALEIVCTPSRHASGRQVIDQNLTLWAGFAFRGPEHRVMFSGDTGLFTAMQDIGRDLGPFDVVAIEVGAYGQAWPDWHIGPEQAVVGHQWMRGELLLPIHWGLFDLAYHGWTEPMMRTAVAADDAGVRLATPKPGESFEVGAPPAERWWPTDVPWRTADEYPIEGTDVRYP